MIVEPVLSDPTALLELESCLLLGYIGDRTLLRHHLMEDQVRRLKEGDTLRYHDETKAFVDESVKLLRGLEIAEFGRLLHEAWEVKKSFSPHIASPLVDEVYTLVRQHGAWGGKLSGAGGGGFMFFYCPGNKRYAVEKALRKYGGQVYKFSFTKHGQISWTIK